MFNGLQDDVGNGAEEKDGLSGRDGKSAYELYKEIYGYEGTEEEWLHDLIGGKLSVREKYTVAFDTDGGGEIDSQQIEDGRKVKKPTDPTKEGYTFDGWYLYGEPWMFSSYIVTEDMVLTAKWTENYSEFLQFTSNFDGTCYVSGIGSCKDTDVLIPPVSPIGDEVTSIGDSAFENCTSLTSIEIPSGVTSIGYNAFNGCTSLTSIEIPSSVTSIGSSAFSGCSSLTNITYDGTMAQWTAIRKGSNWNYGTDPYCIHWTGGNISK